MKFLGKFSTKCLITILVRKQFHFFIFCRSWYLLPWMFILSFITFSFNRRALNKEETNHPHIEIYSIVAILYKTLVKYGVLYKRLIIFSKTTLRYWCRDQENVNVMRLYCISNVLFLWCYLVPESSIQIHTV